MPEGYRPGVDQVKLYLVFQHRDGFPDPEVQGVFSTPELAEKECLTENYCICPLILDESRGHDRAAEWPGAYFPKANS